MKENTLKEPKMAQNEQILCVFNYLRYKNLVKTQKDFATFLEMNEQTISAAMRGREGYATARTLSKINEVLQEKCATDIEEICNGMQIINNGTNNVRGDQKILGSQDTEKIVQTLTQEMAAQREQYAAQFERLFNMLEREQSRTAELIKRLQ